MDYRRRSGARAGQLKDYAGLAFHLPYAYQARRMFSEIYMEELKVRGEWMDFIERNGLDVPCADDYEDREQYITKCSEFLRAVTKTEDYLRFVSEYIAPGEWASSRVGNLYAGSVFLSLMALLEDGLNQDRELTDRELLVFAYGSGSKAKVFAARVQEGWQSVTSQFDLQLRLDHRQEVSYATYEKLHRCGLDDNIANHSEGTFFLADVHDRTEETEGVRHYRYAASSAMA